MRKLFLILLLASLGVSALLAIFVFLVGDFGDIELRILATTLTIGGYSLTGLCSSVLYARRKNIPLAISGMIASVLGFLITVGATWEILDSDDVWRLVLLLAVLAFSIAHASLLLLVQSDKKIVNFSLKATIGLITIVGLMLIYLVLTDDFLATGDFYYRLLGVFAVLDVLGTIATPVLKKFYS